MLSGYVTLTWTLFNEVLKVCGNENAIFDTV